MICFSCWGITWEPVSRSQQQAGGKIEDEDENEDEVDGVRHDDVLKRGSVLECSSPLELCGTTQDQLMLG